MYRKLLKDIAGAYQMRESLLRIHTRALHHREQLEALEVQCLIELNIPDDNSRQSELAKEIVSHGRHPDSVVGQLSRSAKDRNGHG